MNIITGYRGEPHITAQEDRDINLGVVGKSTSDLYVLDVGQQLDADIVSANEIRIRDGVLVMQGCAASIDYGTYDSLTISNGSQGMERIDVIAAQYEKDGDTNVETVSLVVVEGTPAASDPTAPTLTGGSIQGGDTLVQMPLYYVNLDGVSIDSVEQKFTITTNLAEGTISPDVLAKWDDITGETANLDQIADYIADNMSEIIYEDYGNVGTISIAAGTVGTYANVRNITITKTGYKPLSATLINVGHPSAYIPLVLFSSNDTYVSILLYRSQSAAYTVPADDIKIRVAYIKE